MTQLASILPVLTATTLASLLGSGHCIGMCGAFATFASGATDPRPRSTVATLTVQGREPRGTRLATNGAYALGRLTTYLLAGAVAGLFGAALNLGGTALGLQRAALVLAGASMVLFGGASFLRQIGVRIPRLPLPGTLQRVTGRGHRAAAELQPVPRALLIGLLSTLLPCGWLYAFVLIAAGSGSAWTGALIMGAFWLGTVPALAAVGFGAQALIAPLRRRAPAALAALPLMVAGIGVCTLLGRFNVPALHLAGPPGQVSVEDVRSASEEVPPCCREPERGEP